VGNGSSYIRADSTWGIRAHLQGPECFSATLETNERIPITWVFLRGIRPSKDVLLPEIRDSPFLRG
jgi:hypothetical protein